MSRTNSNNLSENKKLISDHDSRRLTNSRNNSGLNPNEKQIKCISVGRMHDKCTFAQCKKRNDY